MNEKKNFVRILTSTVATVLLTVTFMQNNTDASTTNPFSDALADRYQGDVIELHEKGIIGGFPDGSFKPDHEISRGAAAIMIARALGFIDLDGNLLIETTEDTPSFRDVHSGTSYYNAILALEDQNIVSGNPDGTFGPDNQVTRGAMAIMLANGFELNPHYSSNPFTDIGASSKDSVQALYDYAVTSGTSSTTYGTDMNMIRADFAVMVNTSMHADADSIRITMDGVDLLAVAPGTPENDVIQMLGTPDRTESHFLGYEWLIYNEPLEDYLQIAVHNGVVKEVYSLSEKAHYQDAAIGNSGNDTLSRYPRESQISLAFDKQTYHLYNSVEDPVKDYIVETNDFIAKFYLDYHENQRLSGIRLMSQDTAIKMNFYGYSRIRSQGAENLHERPDLTSSEQKAVNRSNDAIMFDLVNANRDRFNLTHLSLNPDISAVALSHSVDMYENDFFSHQSPTTGSPGERMQSAGLTIRVAENIAYRQLDALEATAALMNSSTGHRDIILTPDYKEIGVGSHNLYYTQKFIR